MDRLEYASANRAQYEDWAGELFHSPYPDEVRVVWAVLSAHQTFDHSVASLAAALAATSMIDCAERLFNVGCLAPANRAGWIWPILQGEVDLPTWSYWEWRRVFKIAGLGYCKLSFACCLIDPFASDVVCLDTHVLRVYGVTDKPAIARVYRQLDEYVKIEKLLVEEAVTVGLDPFPYQWAVWCWQRARTQQRPPDSHDHLWRAPNVKQLPLFNLGET